jgi:hypothetical protein
MSVRIGLMGTGGIGQAHLQTLRTVPEAEIVALCDTDEARVRSVAEPWGAAVYTDGRSLACGGTDDIVLCGAYNLREDSATKEATRTRLVSQDFSLLDFGHELVHISPFPWAKLFRRNVLEGLEFPELSSFTGNDGQYADLVLVFEACCRAGRIGVVEEPLYNYRRPTVRGFSRRTLDVVRAFELVTEYMRKNGFLGTLRDELECVCALHFLHRLPTVVQAPW